jgi:nucleoside-triphosphatase THEP1
VAQPAVHHHGERVGYGLRDVATGCEQPFARRRTSAAGRGFEFADELWAWARHRIVCRRAPRQVLIVDELGRLEAAGRGHLPALCEARSAGVAPLWLLAVRSDCADAVARRIGPIHTTFSPGLDQADRCARLIESRLSALALPQEVTT